MKQLPWYYVMVFLVSISLKIESGNVKVDSIDFYEEILTLVDTLTINTISPLMWQVFYLIKEAFYRDAADYFAGRIFVENSLSKFDLILFSFAIIQK